jgi:hypothetical protein
MAGPVSAGISIEFECGKVTWSAEIAEFAMFRFVAICINNGFRRNSVTPHRVVSRTVRVRAMALGHQQ